MPRASMIRSSLLTTAAVAALLALSGSASAADDAAAPSASYTVTAQTATDWMKGYLKAWETTDADAVVKLFTPNGLYQSTPSDPTQTFRGRAAIHKYWTDVTRTQSNIHGIQGTPIVDGNQAAIEIWVTFRDASFNPKGKHIITLLETNVLTFASSGLVSKNVEYYQIRMGKYAPPAGWGKP